jgi:[protein-PII] uridylyltransferase
MQRDARSRVSQLARVSSLRSSDPVASFEQSMPPAYRSAHDAAAIAAHARIAAARGKQPAMVGLCPAAHGAAAGLCVVADDRPGLLATISAALVYEGLDVMEAEAHTRTGPAGRSEAVDVFWVRRSRPEDRDRPISDEDARRVGEVLVALLEGKLDARALRERGAGPSRPASETIVRFLESADGVLSTLEVETDDRSGLLLALAQALFDQHVQIVESEVKTVGDRVFDRFHIVEFDGKPIGAARRLEIQVAVLSAVQPTAN